MRITLGLVLMLLGAGPTANLTAESKVDSAAAFDRLKTLTGQWRSEDGKDTLQYELTAGGTALLEREISSTRPAMLTLYHRDGDRLMLTHYCMAGNQPRMVARAFDTARGELRFEFLDATNLASPSAGHMHDVTIRFVDENRIESEWQFQENGKVRMTERTRYTRVR